MKRLLVIEVSEPMGPNLVKIFDALPNNVKIVFDSEATSVETVTQLGPYSRWFDKESSSNWSNPEFDEYNTLFLRQQQNWCNDMVRARGHLFLNEVYGMLGLSHTGIGGVVGWMYDGEKHDEAIIDFGCWDVNDNAIVDEAGRILLHLNVQGTILSEIDIG